MKKNNFEIAEEAKDEPPATDAMITANKPISLSMRALAICHQPT
jgi:hypothetical protein